MIIDQYLNYESSNNLFELEVEGFKYWHYIRKNIYDEIINQKYNMGQAHTSLTTTSYFERVVLKFKQVPYWMFRNPLWSLKERDLLILNHQRRVKVKNEYNCIYTDEFIKRIDNSYYVFEQPMLEEHYQPVGTNNLKYFDYLNFKVAVKKEISKKIFKFSFSCVNKEIIRRVLSDISNFFSVELNENAIISMIENIYLQRQFSFKYYGKILDTIKPKAILEIVSYGSDRLMINELAKERGIPIIELQHGTMGKYHISYNFENIFDLSTFPNYIFTFGMFWKDKTRFPITRDMVKVVGWPFYEEKINENKVKDTRNNTIKTILFVSQGTIGKELSQIASEVSKELNNKQYKVIYKLHPGEYNRWQKEYPWLIEAGLEVIDHNKHDMHYYFAQSNVQIGVYSTALFEGLGYGLLTLIIKLYGHEYMEELYNNNMAKLISGTTEILSILESSKNEMNVPDINYLWQSDSLERMTLELKSILNTELKNHIEN